VFCTYLTIYRGNKLPPFYIGSCKLSKIEKGYHGSVSSKMYSKIWNKEHKENPNLFITKILTYHKIDTEAREKELYFHISLNVVKSPMYINMSSARKNGFFGMNVSGSNNPMYGKSRKENHPKGMLGKHHSTKTKQYMSKIRKGKQTGSNNPMYGRKWTSETRSIILSKRIGVKRGPYKTKTKKFVKNSELS